ncbi:hypothetical protein LXL04_005131 [Taraxacum kok-saghyz]
MQEMKTSNCNGSGADDIPLIILRGRLLFAIEVEDLRQGAFALKRERETSIWETRIETRIDSYQSLQEISEDDDDENEDEDDENKITIPPRKKPEREKRSRPPTPKSSDPIREILHDFFQQQKMIDMQWRQLMEKHAYERQLFEQEWRQSMERLKIERLKMDKLWREKKEQRRTREEVLRGWAGQEFKSKFPSNFVSRISSIRAGTIRSVFGPFVDIVKSLDLPGWLVHWGHPGNMAVVLFAMGGYGTYLGFRIRFSDDDEKAMAKDLHPKLLAGMFFFFALGATGGVTSLLTSDRPILESPHAVTGLIGLALLAVQTSLPTLFEGNPGLRNVHGILGSGIMTLFFVHAALGLQLGLSY